MNSDGKLVGLVFGYLTSFLWCLRWMPTLITHIKQKKRIDINTSFIALEGTAWLCGLIYGCLDGLTPVIITNGLGFITIIVIVVNNKYNAAIVVAG